MYKLISNIGTFGPYYEKESAIEYALLVIKNEMRNMRAYSVDISRGKTSGWIAEAKNDERDLKFELCEMEG